MDLNTINDRSDGAQMNPSQTSNIPPRLTSYLIADDLDSIRTQMKRNLKKLGFEGKKFEAVDGKEAIDILEKYKDHRDAIEFIICDFEMPKSTGIDVLNWVRQNEFYKNTPFLMVTTKSEVDNICEAVEGGTDEYIIKPWDLETLLKRIETCWNKYHPSC
jgi:two-component system chemotaxis response regulator CheY